MLPSPLAIWILVGAFLLSLAGAVVAPSYADAALAPLVLFLYVLVWEWRMTPSARDVEIRIDEAQGAHIGSDTTVTVSVSPLSGIQLGTVDIRVATNAYFAEQPDQHWRLDAGEETSVDITLTPIARGPGKLEKLWLRWQSPFGLMIRQMAFDPDITIPITPNLTPQFDEQVEMVVNSYQQRGSRAVQLGGEGSEFQALRKRSSGDDTRIIDWKRSARYRTLLVKEFEVERNQQVILSFDTGYLMSQQRDGLSNLDHSINAGMLLANICLREGDRLGLFAFDSQIRTFAAPVAGLAAYPIIGETLAHLDYCQEETNYTLATSHLLSQLQRRSLLVFFTDFVDTVSASLMADNLKKLAAHHLVVFMTHQNRFLQEEEQALPGSMEQVGRSVVAGSMLQERHSLMRELEMMGVHILEVPHERAAARLINEYLSIKHRELL